MQSSILGGDALFVQEVTANSSNLAPVADAGADQSVSAGADVTLDASGSSDSDGGTISDTWKQIAGTPVTLSAPSAMNPAFTAPTVAAGTTEILSIELTVTDAGQPQATDTCDVKVNGEELPPVVEPPAEEPPAVQPPVDDDDDHH